MSIDTSDRRSGAFRSVTRLVLALMATLFVVGCGSSRGEFVVPGPGPGPGVNTGTLIYNFNVNPQAPLDVPAGITRVEFDLYNGPNGTGAIIDSRNVPFNNPITLTNVSTAVESSVLTFYNEFNFPVLRAVVDVDVVANGSTVVDFAGVNAFVPTFDALTATATPTNLNIGDTAQVVVTAAFGVGTPVTIPAASLANAGVTFESSNPAVASVDANGLVTGNAFGTATVTAELTTNDSTHSDTVDFNVSADAGVLAYITVTPETLTLLTLTPSYQLTVAGFDSFDDPVEIDLADFTFESSDETTLTVDANGVVTPGVPGSATVTVTNDDDATITASSEITVTNETVDSIAFFDGNGDPISALDLYVSEVADLHVTATLSDTSEIVDFQDQGFLDVTAGDEYLGFVDGAFIALHEVPTPGTPETATISVDTTVTTDNLPVTEDIDVDVRRVQMTEVAVRIGGIDVDLTALTPSASIPSPGGYTGVVEVIGTFEDGSVRELAGNGNDYSIALAVGSDFTIVTPGLFQTNEAITADSPPPATDTLTITLAADRRGDIDPIDIELTMVDSSNPTAAGATFTNYDDEDRLLIENGPAREVDLRVDFDGVQNFRIAYEDVFQVLQINVNEVESFGHWPMLQATSDLGGLTDVEFEISADGLTVDVTVILTGVDTEVPTFFGILPDDVTPFLEPGQSASFSTFVDYGQGQVNRTADYPVFEEFYDFISEVYVTLDADAGAVNFFLKGTPNNPPLSVRIVDLTGAPQTAIGAGEDTVQITATP